MVKVSKKCYKLIEKLDSSNIASVKKTCLNTKNGRRGPPTAKQLAHRKRFKTASDKCKKTKDYRGCMKVALRK